MSASFLNCPLTFNPWEFIAQSCSPEMPRSQRTREGDGGRHKKSCWLGEGTILVWFPLLQNAVLRIMVRSITVIANYPGCHCCLLRSKQTCLPHLLHKHCLEISSSTSYRCPVLRCCASYVTRNCLGQCLPGFYDEQLPTDSFLGSSSQLVGHLPIHQSCRVEGQPCSKSCRSILLLWHILPARKSQQAAARAGWRITCVQCLA